ncbi:helix-turn-helix domain-containing protein [Streptomyces sp. NPDC048639]|uniref:helix-turn-helix domain-containing protein n=1 Tax=Streptomyces sp. NPDC048639 TaxID=3365581 RepID=UPI00371D4186
MDETLADRVRAIIGRVAPSQAAFAEVIGITGDKLSKSLSGARRFTSLELALIADAGGVTVDWLLGGRPPARPAPAARTTVVPAPDLRELEDLAGRYTAAYDVLALLGRAPELAPLPAVPEEGTPHEQGAALAERVLRTLRDAGVPPLPDLDTGELIAVWARVFGVDVAITRLPGGMDGLSWHADGFRLAVVATHPVWTRQRFTLAHELAHVLSGDAQELLAESGMAPGLAAEPDEIRANAFAAALLMPEEDMRAEVSGPPGEDAFARLVTRYRVSPSAMAARLRALGLIDDACRGRLRRLTTTDCHERAGAIDACMAQAAGSNTPLPPVRLVNGLFTAYRAGETTLRPLAALLDSDVDDVRILLSANGSEGGSEAELAEDGEPVFTP